MKAVLKCVLDHFALHLWFLCTGLIVGAILAMFLNTICKLACTLLTW